MSKRSKGPRFQKGEFVKQVGDDDGEVVRIVDICFSEELNQYRYHIQYCRLDYKNNELYTGGRSCWWPESRFTEITNPRDLLIIQKFKAEEEKEKLLHRVKQLEQEIEHLNFSLNVIKPLSNKKEDDEE